MGYRELTALLILLPLIAAPLYSLFKGKRIQSFGVISTGILLGLGALFMIPRVPFSFSPEPLGPLKPATLVDAGDFALLLLFLYYGFAHRHRLIQLLSGIQILLLIFIHLYFPQADPSYPVFHCDRLSLLLILIISLIGPVIVWQALAYLENHEKHLQIKVTRRHRFFPVLILFLGAMNGVVLSNDLRFFYFFFEITTLCSFWLILHDRTAEALTKALQALWMNSLAGLALLVGLLACLKGYGTLDLQEIIQRGSTGIFGILPLIFLCLSGFIKSAQFPFQNWLLGAMVAPTPVSALLHSSTMVKIGVYFVMRLTPAFQGTFLSYGIALFGAFSFLAAAALAVGQSNGKKVLAYSTISNLGLMFAMAGLNTPEALNAGLLLILFHALTKALLFLSVGVIEQHLDSRNIEDMAGLYARIPLTALITVMGIIMMIMPPFGLVLGKWMAFEAAARNLPVMVLLTAGSALTVIYWARWAGTLMAHPFSGPLIPEKQPIPTWTALGALGLGGLFLGVAAPWVYQWLLTGTFLQNTQLPYTIHQGALENRYGGFAVLPLSLVAFLGLWVSVFVLRWARKGKISPPYLSGLETDNPEIFTGPLNQPVYAETKNYYLSTLFSEKRVTLWVNLAAGGLLFLILAGGV